MSTSLNAALGIMFLFLAIVTTFSMYQFWGYPFDEKTRKSSCPQWKMNIHRVLGALYGIIYVILMIQMVPRIWEYQVEFPPRTVVHMMLGITIGVILILKLSILRFFRHFEEWMPVLGTSLLVCTVLLSALSLPFVARERALASSAVGGSVASVENRARVERQLVKAGLPEGASPSDLASSKSLLQGRDVLLNQCVYCHDLKTAISKPRTASGWWRTVDRMATKPTLGARLTEENMLHVTAYLVAITPDLQLSVKGKRERERVQAKTAQALATAPGAQADGGSPAAEPKVDLEKAKALYEEVCTQCHELSDVDESPPNNDAEVKALMQRMIENGLDEEPTDLKNIEAYLIATFAK